MFLPSGGIQEHRLPLPEGGKSFCKLPGHCDPLGEGKGLVGIHPQGILVFMGAYAENEIQPGRFFHLGPGRSGFPPHP